MLKFAASTCHWRKAGPNFAFPSCFRRPYTPPIHSATLMQYQIYQKSKKKIESKLTWNEYKSISLKSESVIISASRDPHMISAVLFDRIKGLKEIHTNYKPNQFRHYKKLGSKNAERTWRSRYRRNRRRAFGAKYRLELHLSWWGPRNRSSLGSDLPHSTCSDHASQGRLSSRSWLAGTEPKRTAQSAALSVPPETSRSLGGSRRKRKRIGL